MSKTHATEDTLTIELDTTELSTHQIRLIKRVNSMISHVLTTDNESEYFDSSSELLKLTANIVKKANFAEQDSKIEYSKQALEFCADILSDQVYEDDIVNYDN